MISLEVGKKYLSSNGDVVKIVHIEPTSDAGVRNCLGVVYTLDVGFQFEDYCADGAWYSSGKKSPHDLVTELTEYQDFKIDEPVMVRNTDRFPWHRGLFAGIDKDGRPMAWINGKSQWTSGNDRHAWEQCRRPTAEELKNA